MAERTRDFNYFETHWRVMHGLMVVAR